MAQIRDETISGLITLAIYDPHFRRGLVDDLEGTLEKYGFSLNEAEMAEVRAVQDHVAYMSDEELVRLLTESPPVRRLWR